MPTRSSGGASTAQLNYVIAARDAQFQRVADRVTKRLERLERQGKKSARGVGDLHKALTGLSTIKTLGGGILGGLSLARFNRELTESLARLDQLGKRARNIGLPVETLQLWTQAAREAGVETSAFQRGLFQLNKVLAEAGTGSKAYLDIFDRLGVRIRDANGELRPMTEVIADVTREFGNLDLATQQLTVEELFGRAGKEMRAFLLDFQNQVAGVEKGFRGASAEAAMLAEELQNMRDRGLGNLTAALDEALVRMDRFLGITQSITDFWNRAAEAIRFATAHGPFSANPQTRISTPFPDDTSGGRPDASRAPPVITPRTPRSRFHPGQLPPHLRLRPEMETSDAPRGRAPGTSPADIRRRQTSERFARILERQDRERQTRIRQAQNLENKLAEARRDEYLRERERLEELTRQREHAAMEQQAVERAQFERARANLGAVIGDFIRGSGDLGNALQGVLNSLSNAIINQFAGQIAGSLLSGAAGGFLSGLFGFQRGGPVQRGRAILVGEGGPEVFVPRTSGHIIPNHVAAAPAGGPTVNLTFNVESTDGPGVREAIRTAEPRLTAAALSAVAVQQSRPGSALSRQNRQAP